MTKESDPNTEAGRRIRDRRIEKGLSQEELGDLLGMRQEAVSSLERLGPRRIKTATEVASALDVSPAFICFGVHDVEALIEAMPDLADRIRAEMDRIEQEGKSDD